MKPTTNRRVFNKVLLVVITLLMLISQTSTVQALSTKPGSDPTGKSQRSIIEKTPWLDPTACTTAATGGPGIGDSDCKGAKNPKVNDDAAFAAAIDKYIQNTKSNSPLIGTGAQFVKAGAEYGVNPAFMVAIAQHESSLGTAGVGNDGGFNPFGNRFYANDKCWKVPPAPVLNPPVVGLFDGKSTWNKYGSWNDGILWQAAYLKCRFFDQNHQTIADIIKIYAPKEDGNSPDSYAATVKKIVSVIIDSAGSAITCGGTAGPVTTQTTTQPPPSDNPGTINCQLASGDNPGGTIPITGFVYYSQVDPRWKDSPYGGSAPELSIGPSGCGPTALAMVLATLKGDASITPPTVAVKYSRFGVTGGTMWGIWAAAAKDYGLTSKDLGTNIDSIVNEVKSGRLVIAGGQGAAPFSAVGHIVVLKGITANGDIIVANPGRLNGDNQIVTPAQVSAGLMKAWVFTVNP